LRHDLRVGLVSDRQLIEEIRHMEFGQQGFGDFSLNSLVSTGDGNEMTYLNIEESDGI
jgi:hypothetical protein